MDASKIIPQGELGKFKIDIKDKNFDIDFDDFTILLSYGMMGESLEIKKSDCIIAAEGCYFSFDTSKMIGKVTAVCAYDVGDSDTGGVRRRVDMQMLCFVTPVPCPRFLSCPACAAEEHLVEYTRITESDVTASYELLCDCYGNVFVTRDLMNIYVLAKQPEDNNNE
jgi:hypothetical protein